MLHLGTHHGTRAVRQRVPLQFITAQELTHIPDLEGVSDDDIDDLYDGIISRHAQSVLKDHGRFNRPGIPVHKLGEAVPWIVGWVVTPDRASGPPAPGVL